MLRQVRRDLAYFPGRLAMAWRVGALCALMTLVAMQYGIPESAISCYLILFVMKPDAAESMAMGIAVTTNIKNNANIIEMLSNNVAVDILVLPDSGLMHYGQFHLNLAAGLEDSIISVISPAWNGIQRPVLKSEEVVSTEAEIITHSRTKQFTFNMTDTYWRRGFFNVPVVSSQNFGKDGESIKIILRDGVSSITAMINRTANQSGSPRIMGGVELRQYFQLSYIIGDVAPFELITQNMMKLK